MIKIHKDFTGGNIRVVEEKDNEIFLVNDQLFGQDWNKSDSPTFAAEMLKHPECALAFTLESAYFGTADNIVTSEKLLKLGQAFARAVKEYARG